MIEANARCGNRHDEHNEPAIALEGPSTNNSAQMALEDLAVQTYKRLEEKAHKTRLLQNILLFIRIAAVDASRYYLV